MGGESGRGRTEWTADEYRNDGGGWGVAVGWKDGGEREAEDNEWPTANKVTRRENVHREEGGNGEHGC